MEKNKIGISIDESIIEADVRRIKTFDAPGVHIRGPGRTPDICDLNISYNHVTGDVGYSPDLREIWRYVASGEREHYKMLEKYCDAVAEFFSTLHCELETSDVGVGKIYRSSSKITPYTAEGKVRVSRLGKNGNAVQVPFGEYPGDKLVEEAIARCNKDLE